MYSRDLQAAVKSKLFMSATSNSKYLHLFKQQSTESTASFDLPCSSAVVDCRPATVVSVPSTVGVTGNPFDPMGGPPLMRPPPDHHLHHHQHQLQNHHRQSIVTTNSTEAYVISNRTAADTRIDLSALDVVDDGEDNEHEDEETRRQRHQYHLDLQHQQHQQQHHENAMAAAAVSTR